MSHDTPAWRKIVAFLQRVFRKRSAPARLPWSVPQLEEVKAQYVAPNRATRRALERARRRRDKFVTPKGPQVVKQEREPSPPRPNKQPTNAMEVELPNREPIIADELVEGDGQGKVLFERSEFYGEFNFRDSILDQLDRYWVYLARMKKHDPDAYGFYKQLGATLIPYAASGSRNRLEPLRKMTPQELTEYRKEIALPSWFKQQRPAFGCIAVGSNPLAEQHEMEGSSGKKLLLDSKVHVTSSNTENPPPELQPMAGGDIYQMTVWWDRPQDKSAKRKWGTPQQFGVFVSRDGETIQILRVLKTEMVRVGRKGNNRKYELIPQHAWHFPHEYSEWAQDYGLDVQTLLAHAFTTTVRRFEYSNFAMARVTVMKDDMSAVFGVDPRRLSYFFQDRDIELTVNGVRRRIFHFVAPHVRNDGRAVRAHFRGAREFDWAGYRVLITVPGLHHASMAEFDVGMIDGYWSEDMPKGDVVTQPHLGQMLANTIRGKPLKDQLRGSP